MQTKMERLEHPQSYIIITNYEGKKKKKTKKHKHATQNQASSQS